jgi:hypothetical protein
MTTKSPEKKRARALQEQTGWAYSDCLRCVRTMTEEQIDVLIAERANKEGTW